MCKVFFWCCHADKHTHTHLVNPGYAEVPQQFFFFYWASYRKQEKCCSYLFIYIYFLRQKPRYRNIFWNVSPLCPWSLNCSVHLDAVISCSDRSASGAVEAVSQITSTLWSPRAFLIIREPDRDYCSRRTGHTAVRQFDTSGTRDIFELITSLKAEPCFWFIYFRFFTCDQFSPVI